MEKTKVHISKRTVLIASALVLAIGMPLAYLLITNTSKDSSAWYNTSWLYRRSIFISNTEAQAINEEVLIEYDTKSLIDAGKLQNDCDDLRFVDSDDSTLLPYWIEGGCNSSQTQVWVMIPNLPASGKTIYMYYGNESAPNGQEEWTGDFLLLKDSACTNEWKMENIPKYLSVLYGQASNDSMAPTGVITMATALPPLGWTRFSQLDEYYPYGSSSYGTTGGSSSHTHSISATTGSDTAVVGLSTGTPSIPLPIKSTHTHNITGELQPYSNDPPYIKVLFIKKNSSKRATINNEEIPNKPPSSPTNLLTEGLVNPISITSQSPKFSAIYSDPNLDNGIYFEIEVNTKADFTGTSMWDSGKTSISPIISGQRSPEISYMGKALSLDGITYYWRIRFWDSKNTQGEWSQTAMFTTSTQKTTSQAILPQQDEPKEGGEEVLGESNTIPNPPGSPYTEGSSNPTKVTDTTPEFSAIFSDPDASDTGVYYEIEVNTQSDFFGTVMWDSTKTAISPITNGSRSPDISYAGTTLSLNGATYYWRIRFWDNNGAVSNWSQTSNFTMSGNPFSPTYLKTDGMENPTWILSTTPKFSALHTDPNSDSANYYEIEINSNSSFTGTVMWDTGKVSMTSTPSGSRSPEITYAGTALTGSSGTTYYWRIRFWDTDGNVSEWSDTATFKDFIQTEEYIQIEKLKLEGIKIN